ncbi:hypothetical protein HNP38_001151 [Chryseobacterium defluvii]|uniref:Uncharacterized protein n=1 Tax=Chryseobacterium defluvii TaxID=160396 RepID=A0A840K978_9FLAO|nr:transposase [Chryseobacterium defluvii]MBB4805879.1 hypothetical protein [Chryseobacterium defluvii]
MEKENFKKIHIGELVRKKVKEYDIDILRICNFFKCTIDDILQMYDSETLDTGILLRWSKLLKYDFFRFYTQHLILYAPPSSVKEKIKTVKTSFPKFRKNMYTREVIYFILELISSGEKTKNQVVEEYRIPKTTLYKWISKYSNENK